MRPIWTIAKREILSFFVSPIAYVVLLAWMLFSGISFYYLWSWYATHPAPNASQNPLSAFFGGSLLFFIPLLVFAPVMTMRLVSEERRSGTIESLLTAPISATQVVLGKYFAALVFWITLWIPTLLYVWLTSRFGDVDAGVLASTYLGVLGIGLHYMAIGLLMSSVSRNQIVASIMTFLVLGMLFAIGLGGFFVEDEATRNVFEYMSVFTHMDAFAKGIVDSRYVVYDLSLTALALLLAVLAVSSRRRHA